MTIGARVRQCRLALGWSQTELARKLNVKQQSIDQLEAGKVAMPRYVIELADILSVPLEWLRYGRGKLRFAQAVAGRGRSPTTWTFESGDSATGSARLATLGGSFELNGEWFYLVPIFDSRANSGPDSLGADNADATRHSVFRQEWVGDMTAAAASDLALLRVSGDSMWDTLHNGDHVLLDRSARRFTSDGIYALRFADTDGVAVRRISRDPTAGRLAIKTDNPAYGAPLMLAESEIAVEGRVIWLGRTLG